MAGEEAMEASMGVKVRRRSSMFLNFSADYIDVPSNPSLMKLLQKQVLEASADLLRGDLIVDVTELAGAIRVQVVFTTLDGDKQVLFADNVMKVNRKAKLVRRVIIITDVALYILDPTFYRLKHRYALQAIGRLCSSELSDYFFAVSVPTEYDCLMASTRKSEILTVLVEAVKQLLNSSEEGLQVDFCNSFEYYIDAEHVREVHFQPVEGGGVKTKFVDK